MALLKFLLLLLFATSSPVQGCPGMSVPWGALIGIQVLLTVVTWEYVGLFLGLSVWELLVSVPF